MNREYSMAILLIKSPYVDQPWSQKADMPAARYNHTAVESGGMVYVMGGYNAAAMDTNWMYDPITNTYTVKAVLPLKRDSHNACKTDQNKIVMTGGHDGAGYSPRTDEYDPVANTWTVKADMPVARSMHAQGSDNGGGRIYVTGGWNGAALATHYVWDRATNTWTQKTDAPNSYRYHDSVGPGDGYLYLIGGSDGTSHFANTEQYNFSSNTWAAKAAMPVGKSAFKAVLATYADGTKRIVVSSGVAAGGSATTTTYEYDHTANTWTTRQANGQNQDYHGAAAVNDEVFLFGGLNGTANDAICMRWSVEKVRNWDTDLKKVFINLAVGGY